MSDVWKARLDGALRRGEVAGLYFTTALLVVVEFSFVCWLNRIPIPDVPTAGARFIVLPPWYRKPRFEVTLLLTILAGIYMIRVCSRLGQRCRGNFPPAAGIDRGPPGTQGSPTRPGIAAQLPQTGPALHLQIRSRRWRVDSWRSAALLARPGPGALLGYERGNAATDDNKQPAIRD